jgi:hypothetical protein
MEGQMLELRRGALAAAAALLMVTVGVGKSFAVESSSFTNTLGGASVGVPAGAAPPQGVYTGIEVVWPLPATAYGNAGASSANPTGSSLKIGAAIGIIPVVWSTGWNIFGANYTVSVIQPFYTAFTCTTCSGPGPYPGLVLPTVANTVWQPINLSWKLGGGWFFDAAFSFVAPDGSNWATTSNPDYWSFAPGWAISYLDKNWVVSANMAYFINTKSGGVCCALSGTTPGTGYLSGQEFYLDWTALYRIGKWEIGPVGYVIDQTTSDVPGGNVPCAALAGTVVHCGVQQAIAAGALVGYDFGPMTVQAWVTDQFYSKDTPGGGVSVWTRFGFRIWGPEAASPIVTKN